LDAALAKALRIDPEELASDSVLRQIHLPVRMGGLGIRPYARNVSFTSFYAARAAAQSNIVKYDLPEHDPTPNELEFARVYGELKKVGVSPTHEDKVYGQLVPSRGTVAELRAFHGQKLIPHLQHRLQVQVDETNLKKLKERWKALSPPVKLANLARLRACVQPGARCSLVRPPINAQCGLTNDEFCGMVRVRVGLSFVQFKHMPDQCACGAKLSEKPANHLLTCKIAASKGWIQAHNTIVRALGAAATECGYQVTIEPVFNGRGVRPDAMLVDPRGVTTLVDVSCVQTEAASNSRRGASHDQAAIERREKQKTEKFVDLARELNCEFCPFVVERTGGFGKAARHLMLVMAGHGQQFSTHESGGEHPPLARIWATLTKALHQGNAVLMSQALMTCRTCRIRRDFFAPIVEEDVH
jgi:hypothetical protein